MTQNTKIQSTNDQVEMSAIALLGITKRYRDTTVLQDFTLVISTGEFIVLLGPSGCGKSTLLKIIAGLEDATEGEVYIGGRLVNYVPPKARDVSMVFQNYALYPHMTVEENLAFPLKMRGAKKDQIVQRVDEVAHMLGLESYLKMYPETLSGGQRQRVALGRAIIRDPVAFLMDEPLSNLDALLRVQMREELLKLHHRVGRTTIYVTHDQIEAMTMADRIVVMRNGIIQQIGKPQEIYRRPANIFVATFVGSPPMNLYHGRLRGGDGHVFFQGKGITVPLGCILSHTGSDEITLGIRSESVLLADVRTEGAIPGSVELVEPVGADTYLNVRIGEESCVVRVSGAFPVAEGDRVALKFPIEQIHLFDQEGQRLLDRSIAMSAATPTGVAISS